MHVVTRYKSHYFTQRKNVTQRNQIILQSIYLVMSTLLYIKLGGGSGEHSHVRLLHIQEKMQILASAKSVSHVCDPF